MISVYLDNCCYNRPYDDQNQYKISLETHAKVIIQEMIKDKRLNLIYSYVSEYENSNNPNKGHSRSIADFFKRNGFAYVDFSREPEIQIEMNEIMKTGIKRMDALQIASAIIGKADYFLTTDKRLLKYKTSKIKIMNPSDFVETVEV